MQKKSKPGFHCAVCGEWHDELMSDVGSTLPDAVWELGYIERYERARHNADLCTLDDERYFIRCVLSVPLVYSNDTFCWGLWVEVSREDHDRYIHAMTSESSDESEFEGAIANDVAGYRKLSGQSVRVRLRSDSGDRPSIHFSAKSRHRLAAEQRKGIDLKRHHEIIAPYTSGGRLS